MSFGGLILTNEGRNQIAAAVSGKSVLQFTKIQLGDESYNGSYTSKTKLSNAVMELPITRVQRKNNEVIIECDWNSRQAPKAFYLREIGVIGNDVLCYYDNAREGDTEFIDPGSEVIAKQKRFRFVISVTDEVSVSTIIPSGLYAMAEDVENLKKSVSDGKTNVAEAIAEMGIDTVSTEGSPATFGTLADHIRKITPVLTLTGNLAKARTGSNEVTEQIGNPMGGEITSGTSDTLLIPAGSRVYASSDYKLKSLGGNAEAAHVLTGKTFSSNAAGRERAGAMANQGAKTASLNCEETYTIPAGYHNGSGKVTANSLASQTAPDSGKNAAGTGQILTGYQAYINGSKVSGTMANQGAKTASLNCGGTYTIPAGYHNGSGNVTANSLASQTAPDSGKSAAGAAQILTGYQAYINGSKVSGTMTNRGAVMQNQNSVGGNGLAEVVYTIPTGYHNGSGKIKTFGAVGTYGGDPSTIKLAEAEPQANAFLWKRDAKLNYAMSLGTEYNVASGTYQNYRIMNFRGGIKAELSNPGWKCTNRSVIIFIRQYILKNGVYAINTDQKATNAIYIQHGRSVRVQETASNIYLTFAWDAAEGKIGITVEGSAYTMHDLYIHIL